VLNFFGERTLIQQTVDRLKTLLPPERIWIITNDYLRDVISKQLPEVPKNQILAEPAQRNTAPAIGLVAHILQSIDPEAVLGVFPADHLIDKPKRYLQLIKPAFAAGQAGQIAVLGIQPRWAETGYGYIELPKGVNPGSLDPVKVKRFREKPDDKTAKKFVKAGNFYWNAGMFFWKAKTYLDALHQYLPATAALIESLPAFSQRNFAAKVKELFPKCENISVDYAVLEKSPNVVGIAADDIGWNDVGSWSAVFERDAKQSTDNITRTELLALHSTGNFVDAPGKVVAILGVNNLVIVETADALLVADRNRSQQVSEIVKLLEKNNREELL
jgi:mannose-1-phosphate guanylyltransferase